MSDHDELTSAITEIVRATPGVAEIYPARAAGLVVIDQLVRAALPASPTAQVVRVSDDDGVTSAEIRIAITDDAPAADVCRDVYTAVSAHLARRGITRSAITVTVARIVADSGSTT